jgi:hypothetical protein
MLLRSGLHNPVVSPLFGMDNVVVVVAAAAAVAASSSSLLLLVNKILQFYLQQ